MTTIIAMAIVVFCFLFILLKYRENRDLSGGNAAAENSGDNIEQHPTEYEEHPTEQPVEQPDNSTRGLIIEVMNSPDLAEWVDIEEINVEGIFKVTYWNCPALRDLKKRDDAEAELLALRSEYGDDCDEIMEQGIAADVAFNIVERLIELHKDDTEHLDFLDWSAENSSPAHSPREENYADHVDPRYSINVPYDYPYKPGTMEWVKKSYTELLKLCKVPEKILRDMTTYAVIITLLNNPYFTSAIAFNSWEHWYEAQYKNTSSLREMLARDDAITEYLLVKENYYNNAAGINYMGKYSMDFTFQDLDIILTTKHFDTVESKKRLFDVVYEGKPEVITYDADGTMTTCGLIEEIIFSPYLPNLRYFENAKENFEKMYKNCAAMRDLMKRDDAAAELIRYRDEFVEFDEDGALVKGNFVFFRIGILERFLAAYSDNPYHREVLADIYEELVKHNYIDR